MIPLRVTALIDAPDTVVRRILGRTDIWTRSVRALGYRAEVHRAEVRRAEVRRPDVRGERPGERAPLRTGDLIRLGSDRPRPDRIALLIPARPMMLTAIVTDGLPRFELFAGRPSFCRIAVAAAGTGAGTLVTVDIQVAIGPALSTALYRRRILAAGQLLLGIVRLAAAETEIVVAGAVIENGRLLVARRTHPPALAGRWELPGGKAEPAETEQGALTRELLEELGVDVEVGDRVGPEVELGENRVLRCRVATITDGRPSPVEHDEMRWVTATELDALDWLPADRSLLPELRALLAKST